jgi:hypothetical protein
MTNKKRDKSKLKLDISDQEGLTVIGPATWDESKPETTEERAKKIIWESRKLIQALTLNEHMPKLGYDTNLEVDYIRPRRELMKGLMLEVDKSRRIAIHNALHYVCVAIDDLIEIIDQIDREE